MKRAVKIIFGGIGLLVIAFFVYAKVIDPILWERSHRSRAYASLQGATSESEREVAVGRLGMSKSFRDGSWIAIYYADTHGGRLQSLGVIRESSGRWLESNDHYCGIFSIAKRQVQMHNEEIIDSLPSEGSLGRACAILTAESLEEARSHVAALGFHAK